MKNKKISRSFFERSAGEVAKDLLGKIFVRIINGKKFKFRIVETEAYFSESDPASRASKGKNKISEMMWSKPGNILIYNVHKYKMFNFVTDKEGVASAVLIRALEPLDFNLNCLTLNLLRKINKKKNKKQSPPLRICSGPGLLTEALEINKEDFHGKNFFDLEEIGLLNGEKNFEIERAFRVGVTEDLPEKYRFYIKYNKCISKK